MTIQAEDLIAPNGDLEYSFFPKLSETEVLGRLDAYIAEGYSKAVASGTEYADEATEHYAYYKAFLNIYLSMSIKPTNMLLTDQGSAEYAPEQARRFLDMSESHRKQFRELIGNAVDQDGQFGRGTNSAENRYRW